MIEALVALAVMAAGLGAIGELGFATVAAARRADTRLYLTATARKAYAALPNRSSLADGALNGEIDGAVWRVYASPFSFSAPGATVSPPWTPQAVRLAVTGSSGGEVVIDTVRLRPTGGSR